MILSLAASRLLATTGTCTATGHAAMAHHRAVAVPTNTICPVLGNPVTPGKSAVVTVRGHAYYVWGSACKAKLEAHPGNYLLKDGTPRNASQGARAKTDAMAGMHQMAQATNTICPVSGYPVKPGMGIVVTIRGHRYRVCHVTDAKKLVADPDRYLTKDGTPKNELHKDSAPKHSMSDMPGM